jgi:5-hydroxyisourate hydrolase
MSQITTHILDLSAGTPASGVSVTLFQGSGDGRVPVSRGKTDSDGRVSDWLEDGVLAEGVYSIAFDSGEYFRGQGVESFYPHVEIAFRVAPGGQHYHVPLLLSPWGYSTYRGS